MALAGSCVFSFSLFTLDTGVGRPFRAEVSDHAARERPTSGAATAFLLAASSELVAMDSQPQALLGEGWLKSTSFRAESSDHAVATDPASRRSDGWLPESERASE